MPTLDWIGKKAVVNHHREVPYRLIHCDKDKSSGDPEAGNLLVQGDNLEALKALLPYYAGKVKCIYIDPPYNTGNESWVYNDNVNSPEIKAWLGSVVGKEAEDLSRHDKWLCMMYPRLRLLKDFLREDGVILVSIDDYEIASLRYLMDEAFGKNNFIAQMVWEKSRKNDAKFVSVGHEYILIYARNLSKLKNDGTIWREKTEGMQIVGREYRRLRGLFGGDTAAIETGIRDFYKNLDKSSPAKKYTRYNKVDERGIWRDDNMSWPGGGGPRYDVYHPVTQELCVVPPGGWRYATPEKMSTMIAKGVVVFRKDHTEPPIRKTYLTKFSEEDGTQEDGLKVMTSYLFRSSLQASNTILNIFGEKKFDYPKDHEILARLISYVSDDDDIILDSFAGSGSTGHAGMELNAQEGSNRKFVLVEIDPSTATQITGERLRRISEGYQYVSKGKTVSVDGLGSGFCFCALGEPLFDADGNVSPTVTFPDLAAHVFFCETGSPIPKRVDGLSPLIGTFQSRAIYLLHSAESVGVAHERAGNVLTGGMLDTLPLPNLDFTGARIVYAEGCTVPDDRLSALGVTFKQIPYQIEGI
mgnify:CR=1 FL=1